MRFVVDARIRFRLVAAGSGPAGAPNPWGEDSKPPFEELYRHFLRRIYGYVRAQVGNATEAEDVTSQVFIKAYEAYARYQPQAQTPAAWLFRIARNASLDHHRRVQSAQRTVRAVGAQPVELVDPARVAHDHIQHRQLMEAVACLPERQREAVSLRHASELSFREIGELMGCSEDAAKMLYHRALKALREAATALREE